MIYFEFSDWLVNNGMVPAKLCYKREMVTPSTFQVNMLAQMADRVFEVKGNTRVDFKNRQGVFETLYISDEEKVVLALKAVLI